MLDYWHFHKLWWQRILQIFTAPKMYLTLYRFMMSYFSSVQTQTGPVHLRYSLSICDTLICFISVSYCDKADAFNPYPPQLRASGEARGEPSPVPSCLGTNELSDTAADALVLHLYSSWSTGEESGVLCPNHNSRASLSDESLRAEGQDCRFTQHNQQLQPLENLKFLFVYYSKEPSCNCLSICKTQTSSYRIWPYGRAEQLI